MNKINVWYINKYLSDFDRCYDGCINVTCRLHGTRWNTQKQHAVAPSGERLSYALCYLQLFGKTYLGF